MKRYDDCQYEQGGDCAACSLSSYGKDCRGNPAHPLAYVRTRAGLTQAQLAERIGKRVMYISQLETGRRDINGIALETGVQIAEVCGCDVKELLP